MSSRVAVALGIVALLGGCTGSTRSINGVVRADTEPVAGAVVRIQATERSVLTDVEGRFEIATDTDVSLSAWAPGYFIGGGDEHSPGAVVEIDLTPIPSDDNQDYVWLSAVDDPGTGEDRACAGCHSAAGTGLDVTLPVDQWLQDAHATSARNPRFVSMYAGTDLAGNKSPPTRYVQHPDYGRVPIRPDPTKPYYGPGYTLDFPDTSGNCGSCHVPAAAADDAYGVDPRDIGDTAAEGVTCDVCHKVWDVRLDDRTGLPGSAAPGVLTYEFRRPPEGHQFFAGPYDDVAPGEDTYLPLQSESRFCAGCHHGVFWGVTVYDSFGEWLSSPYSDAENGQTCQDCHMPPTGADTFALPEEGGMVRDPTTIPGHLMPGASDEALLRAAVTMNVTADRRPDRVNVDVEIVNDRTGHHVPTGSPLRHLILLVTAGDDDGQTLPLLNGPTVPDWGGVGDPVDGFYGGHPGTAYAKVLEELWTELSPTGAYWNPTRVLSDNRIPAMGKDVTEYNFAAPPDGDVRVEVMLLFRRAYIELAKQKGWNVDDIVMARETVVLSASG